ncbi:hydrogenase maturation protein HypF [Candidatus Caldarchaeum subterraneum]|uniref:Hydrogenase maturation protein HypF n=1 Tax=Caldiarchaeum subterraneum TaxID=311458 RepID=E6N703_CALS0|nr:hydrogenase maturation protein HypF [Candidatus Caldarchaeum subterraneum]BAJ50862.1 hydrogenase maturation protein HypF [Candidatus Caldarchaeum subterraneum]
MDFFHQLGGLAVREAAKLVDIACISAAKELNRYLFTAPAVDDQGVVRLRRRKNKPTEPFAIMCLNEYVSSRLLEQTPKAP